MNEDMSIDIYVRRKSKKKHIPSRQLIRMIEYILPREIIKATCTRASISGINKFHPFKHSDDSSLLKHGLQTVYLLLTLNSLLVANLENGYSLVNTINN